MSIQTALFFDNDLEYCKTFGPWCKHITPFHVGGYQKPAGQPFPVLLWNDPVMIAYKNQLTVPARNFMERLEMATEGNPPDDRGDVIDYSSGITYEQAQFLFSALERKSMLHGGAPNVAAIFDFDRTLSLFEGFIGANSPPVVPHSGIQGYLDFLEEEWPADGSPATPDGFIEYMFGGPNRKEMIQALIHQICQRGHPLVILTNNSIAINNPEMFKEFFPLDAAYPGFLVVCGAPYDFHKPTALHAAHIAFAPLFAGDEVPEFDQYIIRMDRTAGQNQLVERNYIHREPVQTEVLNLNLLFPLPAAPAAAPRHRTRRNRTRAYRKKRTVSRKI